jgi:hypothetical protein
LQELANASLNCGVERLAEQLAKRVPDVQRNAARIGHVYPHNSIVGVS